MLITTPRVARAPPRHTASRSRIVGRCGDDLSGLAVHIGARVVSLADGDQILVSAAIPALVVGSGIEFDDVGEHPLKSVPGLWRLYAVRV